MIVAWVNDDGARLLEVCVEEDAVVRVTHAQDADLVVPGVGPVQVLVHPVEGDAVGSTHSFLHQ